MTTYFYLIKYKDSHNRFKIGITRKNYPDFKSSFQYRFKDKGKRRYWENMEVLYFKRFRSSKAAFTFEERVKKTLLPVRLWDKRGYSEDFYYNGSNKSLVNFIREFSKKNDYKTSMDSVYVKSYSYKKNGKTIKVNGYFRKKKEDKSKLDFLKRLFSFEYGNSLNPVII